MRLILASSSPRRREILSLLRVSFEVVAPTFDEVVSQDIAIGDEVVAFARGKAASVASGYPGATIIGIDTMIALGNCKIGKPADETAARHMLTALAGNRHTIYTSVVILDLAGGPGLAAVDTVEVEMRSLTKAEIDAYLAEGESLDKAGGYSIQGGGRQLIRSIDGDYLTAVGLPLRPIGDYLAAQGIPHADIDTIYAGKEFYNWGAL